MAKKIIATPKLLNSTPDPGPRRGFPTWLKVLLVLAVLVPVSGMVLPFFIPWDKVKDQAVAAASEALGRELAIGKIDVGLLSGVHIHDLRLANAKGGFSDQALFSNTDAKVDVNFLSLLTGKVVISDITFIHPQLLLETNAKGVSNLQGLGAAPAEGAAKKPKAAEAPAPSASASGASGGKPFPAEVVAFEIQDGDLVIRDRQKGTETAVRGLDLKLTGISLAAAGASHLEMSLNALVEGKVIPLTLASDFRLDLPTETVDIRSFTITAPALAASLTGSVSHFSKPVADLKFGAELQLDKLKDLLPPSDLAKLPPDLKTSGSVKLDVSAKGAVSDWKSMALNGGLTFDKVQAVYGGYPALGDLQGTVSFDKAGVDLPALTFKLGGDPVTFAFNAHWGDLANIMGPTDKLKASIRYSVKSPQLNLDPLLAVGATTTAASANSALAPSGTAQEAAAGGPLPSYAKSVPKGLSVDGIIDVDAMAVKGYHTGKMTQHLVLKDQRITSATDLVLYQGKVYERSSADLSVPGPVFKSTLGVDGLVFTKLVDDAVAVSPTSQLAQLKGKVEGRLSIKADVKGRGLAKPWVLDNTIATVDFSFKDGAIRKTDLQEKLAAAIPLPQAQQILRSDITFSEARGQAAYAARRLTLKSFDLGTGADWRQGPEYISASGYEVLEKDLDFRVIPRFNPSQVSGGGDAVRAFEDDKGWPSFDYIDYAGPSQSQAKADFTAGLKKAAGKAVAQHVEQAKKVAVQAAQKAIQQAAPNLIKQLPGGLNKLFGQ